MILQMVFTDDEDDFLSNGGRKKNRTMMIWLR